MSIFHTHDEVGDREGVIEAVASKNQNHSIIYINSLFFRAHHRIVQSFHLCLRSHLG